MQTEFLKEVNGILLRALERPREEWESFLDETCRSDALRREVETLLAMRTFESGRDVDRPAFDLFDASPDTLRAGERIGPYVVERRIGDGGTGAVYLAAKDDGDLKRKVAVKVLKRGMDTEEIVRRFRQESLILAHLDHPNISRWYESGMTADERPYLVMEFIDGEPIHRFCAARRLGVTARLEIFLKVCAAVQVAHQHLVIHRDLKPSNILVTHDGEPKLLDFGIAKILEPDAEEAPTVTVMDQRPMTPAYASPEHVLAKAMTTASDVYSLGVVLYELLTGERPYDLPSPLETDVREVVCFHEPARPSAAVARQEIPARRLRRRLRGDLDNIVLMALAKRPRDRYPSVDQLALDIRRHLAGLPVCARKPTLAYRAGKYLRRHFKGALVTASFVLLLGGYGLDKERKNREIARERDNARYVTEVLGGLYDLFEVVPPERAGAVVKLLDRGTAKAEELRGQPELLAEFLAVLGQGYKKLALYGEAAPLLERVLELRRAVHGEVHPAVAESLGYLADLETDRGDFTRTEELLRERLAIYLELEGPEGPRTLAARHAIAMVLMRQGRYGVSESLFRETLEDVERTAGEDSPAAIQIRGNLAVLLYYRGVYEEAEALYREALEASIEEGGPDSRRSTANKQNLATCLVAQGKLDAAEKLFREVLESRRKGYVDPGHAHILESLGDLALLRSELGEAESLLSEALAIADRFMGKDHPRVAFYRVVQARLRLAKGRPAAAEELVRESLSVLEAKVSPRHWWALQARGVLGAALAAQGRFGEAEPLVVESYRALASELTPRARPVQEAIGYAVDLYERWGRPGKAAEYRELRR